MNIPKNNIKAQNVSFSGHSKKLDKHGYEIQQFYYLYDPEKYDCEVELYNVIKDSKGDLSILNQSKPQAVIPMEGFAINADMEDYPDIDSNIGFAYRFKLTDKATKEASYAFDNGTVIGIFDNKKPDNKYNVVFNNRAVINKNGPMQLIMPDEYYPGIENVDGKPALNEGLRAKALASVRTHANKLGGNFYGIIARLTELEKEGIKRIVGTPFTKDTISSHLYWTENAYQVAPDLGTEKDFKVMQQELFKHDINWISDAALVNEGFGGIHLSELLRKGQDSFSKNMFRTDEKISLGIIPDKCDYTRMKIINAPFKIADDGSYERTNPDYNPAKPTYIQFYDDRLASEEQKKSDSPARTTTYDNKNTDNIYDITKHDDAVYPFPIEVSPQELERNVKSIIADEGTLDLSDVEIMKRVSDFTNFNVINKSAAAGLEVWDGNVDIAKLNFYRCDKDDVRFSKLPPEQRAQAIEDFDKGALAVRDYAINSGKYWTKLTSDTLLEYVSKQIGGYANNAEAYMEILKKLVSIGELPKSTLNNIDEEVINNIINYDYQVNRLDNADMRADINPEGYGNDYKTSDYILRQAMDCPLETLPFATNLLGVITSPYIAKKANTEDELGVSRYDLSKAGNPNLPEKYSNVYNQTENLYKEQIVPAISYLISDIDGITEEDGKVSDLGKYVISEITPDLTKYLFIKALNPEADIKINTKGDFDFTGIDESEYTIQSLGIPYNGMSPEEEAQAVVSLLKQGMENISDAEKDLLKQKITTRFQNRNVNDYKIAEVIIDRTEAGLGWRIDAAKDIAAIDSVRSDADSMQKAWKNVTDFWRRYNEAVREINPHAYTTAEITDLYDLFKAEMPVVYEGDSLAQIDESRFTPEELDIISEIKDIRTKNNGNLDEAKLTEEQKKVLEKTKTIHKQKIQSVLDSAMFRGDADAERKFLEETGITAVANYNYFFSLLPNMFMPYSIENGGNADNWMATQSMNHELRNKLDKGWNLNDAYDVPNTPGFLFNGPDDAVGDSYTFAGNHDKPRIIHGLTLDMSLFHSDFSNEEHKAKAKAVLGDVKDFDKVNSMAVAMGSKLNETFESIVTDKDELAAIKQAVKDLTSGSYKGRNFDAAAFGTRPIEVAIRSVLNQVEYNGVKISNKDALEAKALETILIPAYDRYYSIYKHLITLPGSPTDFAGDRLGVTGAETKAKNYHQQNRNIIRWEWLEKPEYKFVRDFYEKINEIANLRSNPALSALNNGSTVTIPIIEEQKDDKGNVTGSGQSLKTQAMLRYDDDSVVLTLHNLSGSSTPMNKKMERKTTELSTDNTLYNRIVLDVEGNNEKQGLKHGLSVGTKFKNARSGDDSVYQIAKMNNKGKEYYYLKRLSSQTHQEIPIQIKPEDYNTLVLYKVK